MFQVAIHVQNICYYSAVNSFQFVKCTLLWFWCNLKFAAFAYYHRPEMENWVFCQWYQTNEHFFVRSRTKCPVITSTIFLLQTYQKTGVKAVTYMSYSKTGIQLCPIVNKKKSIYIDYWQNTVNTVYCRQQLSHFAQYDTGTV